MSEIVATLPQGTQVVVEAKLLTSDVDHTIEEVRQETIQQAARDGVLPGGGVSRASNRTLFCRKCEGHGQQVVLKGHASRCPYNNCQCKTCSNVMSLRANAIIRRYRTRTLEGGLVLKPVHFKNGNTRLRVFPKYVDESDALPIPVTGVHQHIREKNPSGDNADLLARNQTPPGTLNIGQPPFPVKRSFSEEMDLNNRGNMSPKRSFCDTTTSEQNNPTPPLNGVPLTLLDLLLKQQGLTQQDLINSGLLPLPQTLPNMTLPSSLYDSSPVFSLSSLPSSSVTYSSPTTYASAFIPSPTVFNSDLSVDRKVSDAFACPVTQLSELNIGVTSTSPVNVTADTAPKLTPNMFDTTSQVENGANVEKPEPAAEPFTNNLMIAPTADRSHPLFKQFLNTVRELEKNMLREMES